MLLLKRLILIVINLTQSFAFCGFFHDFCDVSSILLFLILEGELFVFGIICEL